MASEVGCWEVLDRLNNYLKIQQADLSRLLDLGTRPNYGGQWARLSRTFLWNHLDSVTRGSRSARPYVWSDLLQCMVVHVHYGLFFTTASGKSFVGTSQLHDALSKALTECYLVDSIVHLSSLRRMAAMCYEVRFGRMSGLPGVSSLPCGPAASISSSRAL